MPFKKGEGGRPRGAGNKRTKEMREWAREFFNSEEWRRSAKARILKGKAPHLESHIIACEMPKPLPQPPEGEQVGRWLIGWLPE